MWLFSTRPLLFKIAVSNDSQKQYAKYQQTTFNSTEPFLAAYCKDCLQTRCALSGVLIARKYLNLL